MRDHLHRYFQHVPTYPSNGGTTPSTYNEHITLPPALQRIKESLINKPKETLS